jgi:hypothetical protein
VVIRVLRMPATSALHPKADIRQCSCHVCFVPTADIRAARASPAKTPQALAQIVDQRRNLRIFGFERGQFLRMS